MKGKFELIVFDLDGTLVDSDAVVMNAFNYALQPYGQKVDFVGLEKIRSRSPKEVFEGFVPKDEWKNAFGRLASYSEANLIGTPAFPGIKEILEKLRKKNVKIALWTGRDLESAKKILRANAIDGYFTCTVGGCMVSKNKPYPDGLSLVAEQLLVSPEKIIVVGDHVHDMEGTKKFGSLFVGASWSRPVGNNFDLGQTDFIFHTVDDFGVWLESVF